MSKETRNVYVSCLMILILAIGLSTTITYQLISRSTKEQVKELVAQRTEPLTLDELMKMAREGEAGWEGSYSAVTTPASGDYYLTQDVSDTTDGPTGTTKYITFDNLMDENALIDGGHSEMDGDKLVVTWTPSNYTRSTTPAQADALDQLTAHLYGIDQQLASTGAHATSHIDGGSDEIDGDTVVITWTGYTNYTPSTSPSEVDTTDDLTAHLAGINAAIGGGGSHASDHIDGGADAIDGDKLEITYSPTYYTPSTTPSEADSTDDLTAHLYGLEQLARRLPVTTAEPSDEAIGDLYVFDNDTYDPCSLTGTDNYLAITTSTGTPGTYKILLNMVDGTRYFDDIDMSDGTIKITSNANPTTNEAGEIAIDYSDGGQIPTWIEVYDEGDTVSRIVGSSVTCEDWTIIEPDTAQAASDTIKLKRFIADGYPFGVEIISIDLGTDGTDISDTYAIEEWSDEDTYASLVDSIAFSTADQANDGGTISDSTIAAGAYLAIDLDAATDDYEHLIITICYEITGGD